MKNSLFHIVFFVMSFVVSNLCLGQDKETNSKINVFYTIQKDIHYYSDSVCNRDEYIRSQCTLDLYYPKNERGFATVVWFHGGSLRYGAKEIPSYLKEKGIAVVGVDYRLYPTVRAPKYIEDAAAAVAWVFNYIEEFGGDPNLIFISGHSAGGYLTSMVGLDKRWLSDYDIDADRIAGLIPLSGQMITHFTVRAERGIGNKTPIIDDLAPLNHVRKEAPPLLLITGDRDMEMLGRYEENAYLMRMMKVKHHKNTKLYELQGYGHDIIAPAMPLLLKEVKRLSKEK